MLKFRHYTWPLLLVLAALCSGCIKNDIPYPRIQANILSISAEGQNAPANIDSLNRQVTLFFSEEINPYAINIEEYTLTPGAKMLDDILTEPQNLINPIYVVVSLYQEYTWKISASQEIERYFEVEGQIGSPVIDVPGRRVVVYVSENVDLKHVKVLRAKLENTGAVMTPDLTAMPYVDLSLPLFVNVEVFGHLQQWTIYTETVAQTVRTISADGWSRVAWVSAQAEAGKDNGVEYRLAGTEQWTRVPQEDIIHNGGDFTACIKHLSPNTAYQARAYSDTEYAEVLDFTTGSEVQLPNAGFENWWKDGKIWCPWGEGEDAFWGTGNKGATTIGESNTTPFPLVPDGGPRYARLSTVFAGIGPIGKLAAGNIFAGYYVRTDGTDGVLSFGRPFKERPTRLRGVFNYKTAPISHANNDYKPLIGQPDTCIIWVALIDSAEPFEIRTKPANRHLFDPDGPEVVAYGKMECGETVEQFTPFQFELKYKSYSRVPNYILVTASSSKYGDYFTGGVGAVMCLDDLVLEYDY